MAQCNKCGANVPKGTGRTYQIEVATGRSGGSWSFGTRKGKGGQTTISPRYYTGRTYYKKVWVTDCDACSKQRSQKNNIGCGTWIAIIFMIMGMVTCMQQPVKNNVYDVEQPKAEQRSVPSDGNPQNALEQAMWKDLTPEEWQKELEDSKNNSN